MYDIIGDIHGHADELKVLLEKMNYKKHLNSYQHEDRKVIFVGDYIDRGPKIRETLAIVKGMVDAGDAIALMGNHEYNAICYHTRDSSGKYLRAHSDKNKDQHKKTVEQFAGHEEELMSYIEWFKALPLFHETEMFRIVHATWNSDSISVLTNAFKGNRLTDNGLQDAHNGNKELFNALEVTLKGRELGLPAGHFFLDKDGHERKEIRVRWWLKPDNLTYKEYSIVEDPGLPDDKVVSNGAEPHYGEADIPVFFGHYWLTTNPTVFRSNICCLDYSVAQGGKLVAYRYQGERILNDGAFCY